MINQIHIQADSIQLRGFELIDDNATFYVYQGGVIIASQRHPCERDWVHAVVVDSCRVIKDVALLDDLRRKGFSGVLKFANIHGVYYQMPNR